MRRVGVSKEGDKEVNAQAAQKKKFRRRNMVERGEGGKMKRYMDKSIGGIGDLALMIIQNGTAV